MLLFHLQEAADWSLCNRVQPSKTPFRACRFFYASSACIYPENRQLETEIEGGGLKEDTAWPAQVR